MSNNIAESARMVLKLLIRRSQKAKRPLDTNSKPESSYNWLNKVKA